ncbi:MAG: hypothetical protein COV52_07900 [Gammaproteobacteria bacterium CG11_big_fil_rev_8_21_14_0_20_46_22]|nr:MAG: hypothetical protein COW05_03980 [Gammaproteobacteria bacterium CG12_big_fil_rev_8_21_14_0_65_46_12]PIR10679.1 MAG: hypothetical protein COV52_07900 [Gammaproteobacteria bacterium CG11_big_fil_rev_8_21_14_0_20_46_22]
MTDKPSPEDFDDKPLDEVRDVPQRGEVQADEPVRATAGFFSKVILLITFVIAVVALAASAYVWQAEQHVAKPKTSNPAMQNLEASVVSNNQAIAALKAQLDQAQQNSQAEQQTLKALAGKAHQSQGLWQLSDAKHLVQLANYTLSFSHDVPTAVALLKTADARLANVSDPKVYPVRQQLADAIASLNGVKSVDIPGIYMQLNALQKQAMGLSIYRNQFKEKDNNVLKTNNPAEKGSFAHGMWHALSKVVVVRRHDQPIEPLLSSAEHNVVMQNLSLLFSQAQWALVQRNSVLYQESLKQIVSMLQRYFDHDQTQALPIIQAIEKLQAVDVDPKLPSIRDALVGLNNLVAEQNKAVMTGFEKPETTRVAS